MTAIVGNKSQKYLYAPNIRKYEHLKSTQNVHSAEKQWESLKGKRFSNPQYSEEKVHMQRS